MPLGDAFRIRTPALLVVVLLQGAAALPPLQPPKPLPRDDPEPFSPCSAFQQETRGCATPRGSNQQDKQGLHARRSLLRLLLMCSLKSAPQLCSRAMCKHKPIDHPCQTGKREKVGRGVVITGDDGQKSTPWPSCQQSCRAVFRISRGAFWGMLCPVHATRQWEVSWYFCGNLVGANRATLFTNQEEEHIINASPTPHSL